jgi:hypothetical protein
MKLLMLILAAAIAGTVLFACAPPTAAQVCTGGNLNPVPFVATPYAPATNATPTAQNRPINDDVQTDLAGAFAAASHTFQTQLCNLDGIFVDPSGCADPGSGNTYDPTTCNNNGALITDYSWGLRIYPLNPGSGKRYIGLSLGLWNNNNTLTPNYHWQCQPFHVCSPPFSLFYKAFVDTVAHLPAPNSPHGALSVRVVPNSFAENPAMSVLALLAHEFGHVYWFDSFIVDPNTGAPNPGGSFVNKYFCYGNFYPSGNWEGSLTLLPFLNTGRFVSFGDTLPYSGSQVPGLPGTLHNIHGSGHWASALAAFSPSEDFVETFELSVLMRAGLTRLQINSDPIVPVSKGSWLDWKLSCFS